MALITCPDCGKQVSDIAPACVSCGRPMHTQALTGKTQTIEQTGKTFKAMVLIGWIAICIGLFSLFIRASHVLVVSYLIGGLLCILSGRIGRWWYHE